MLAFEIDRDLAGELRETDPALTVVEGDFLETADALSGRSAAFRVAGNLPYNVASPILFKLLDLHASGIRLVDATLMLQHEVAERLTASPGGREYGVLAILVQHTADVERLLTLPPGAFRPRTKGAFRPGPDPVSGSPARLRTIPQHLPGSCVPSSRAAARRSRMHCWRFRRLPGCPPPRRWHAQPSMAAGARRR